MAVSLCMIVRNERANLAACLGSVEGLVDEIVVIDTGSTDGTQQIAMEHGASVYDFPWCDDFSAARNESIRYAKGDWIFWLDADDRVVPGMRTRLSSLFRDLPSTKAGYTMTVVSPGPDGQPMFEALHIRLFRNDAAIRWQYPVHEQIGLAIARAGGELCPSEVSIVHTGYLHAGHVSTKLERNLRLIDIGLMRSPLDRFLLSSRAATLVDLGRPAEALISLHFCEAAHSGLALPACVFALKGRAYALEGDLEAALESTRSGLSLHPRDAKLLFMEAEVLAAFGELDAAAACLRSQLIVGEEHQRFACADRTIAAFRVKHLLADLLLLSGSVAEAARQAREVVACRPSFGPAWLVLAEAALALDDTTTFERIRSRFHCSADAEIGRCFLDSLMLRRRGEYAEAMRLVLGVLSERPGATILAKVSAVILFESGERGTLVLEAIDSALRLEPCCPRLWALRRACARGTGITVRPDARGHSVVAAELTYV
jgi:tetratricopeptide (TPR) repeat protein